MQVFLVEDAPALRERLEAMLNALPGVRTIGHADRAKEAIERILALGPDAVVLDLSLKEGTGFEVMRRVAEVAPQIAFYVLTNHPLEGFRVVAKRLGARGFFDKSNEFEKLRDVLGAQAA